nr:DUF3649 domain-containing protein [Pseudomonas aeruginosa]
MPARRGSDDARPCFHPGRVWVAAIVYAFAARSAWRACWVLALASLALGGLAWLGLDYGARP